MAFRNFVVSGDAKVVGFLPREAKDFSYGAGSPSVSVNNNNVDVFSVEDEATTLILVNTDENPLLVEEIADSDDYPSDENQIVTAGYSGIGSRVRERKGTSANVLKPS